MILKKRRHSNRFVMDKWMISEQASLNISPNRDTNALQLWLVKFHHSSSVFAEEWQISTKPSLPWAAWKAVLGICETKTISTIRGGGRTKLPKQKKTWENFHTTLMSYTLWLPLIVTPEPTALGKQTSTCSHSVRPATDKAQIAREWVMWNHQRERAQGWAQFLWFPWSFLNSPWYYETSRAATFKNSFRLTITMWAPAFVALHKQRMMFDGENQTRWRKCSHE